MTRPRADMKSVTLIAVFLLCANLSLQIPVFHNCTSDFVIANSMADTCETITCDGPDSISSLTCALYQCLPEKYLGYEEPDYSKPYPECCGGPICAD